MRLYLHCTSAVSSDLRAYQEQEQEKKQSACYSASLTGARFVNTMRCHDSFVRRQVQIGGDCY